MRHIIHRLFHSTKARILATEGAIVAFTACYPVSAFAGNLGTGDFGTAGTAASSFLGNGVAVALGLVACAAGAGLIGAGVAAAKQPEHHEILHRVMATAGIIGLTGGVGSVLAMKGPDMMTHLAQAAGAVLH